MCYMSSAQCIIPSSRSLPGTESPTRAREQEHPRLATIYGCMQTRQRVTNFLVHQRREGIESVGTIEGQRRDTLAQREADRRVVSHDVVSQRGFREIRLTTFLDRRQTFAHFR